MKLTDFQKTKRGRISLFFDGEYYMSVSPDVFAASRLSVGDQVDEERLRELEYEAAFKAAKEKALSLLSYKEYTEKELADRLCRAGHEREIAAEAVERMKELGLLDDEAYAQRYARDLRLRRGFGDMRIRQEMRLKGIGEETIAFAISLLPDDTLRQIRELLEKKYPDAWEDDTAKRRAYGALQRRGFSFDDIRRAFSIDPEEFLEE